MQVNIISFGQIREITGPGPFLIKDLMDTDQLRQRLLEQYPALGGLPYLLAVDKNIVTGNTELSPDATIALLPPYSGG